jgi:Raf kinase inhibitor-like YbhB/YbcL family protein
MGNLVRGRGLTLTSFLAAALASCARGPSTDTLLPEDPKRSTVQLSSPAFPDGGAIPKAYTCDGNDASPPLAWSGVPESARSLALVCEDPDAPGGTFTHWLIVDIPAAATALKEGVSAGDRVEVLPGAPAARQGKNDFGKLGYGGPCPPKGTHHYIFRLFALDDRPDPGPNFTEAAFARALTGHIVAEGRLTGTYAR